MDKDLMTENDSLTQEFTEALVKNITVLSGKGLFAVYGIKQKAD
jgi:hypothetical protein